MHMLGMNRKHDNKQVIRKQSKYKQKQRRQNGAVNTMEITKECKLG